MRRATLVVGTLSLQAYHYLLARRHVAGLHEGDAKVNTRAAASVVSAANRRRGDRTLAADALVRLPAARLPIDPFLTSLAQHCVQSSRRSNDQTQNCSPVGVEPGSDMGCLALHFTAMHKAAPSLYQFCSGTQTASRYRCIHQYLEYLQAKSNAPTRGLRLMLRSLRELV